MDELISVIIPCFNVEKYIDRCLESVLNQTYQNLEIILVDDGSTDSTAEIMKRYAEQDCRIKILYQENRGAGAARNAGLKIAKGDYIGFVDSDDWVDKDIYEYLIGIIKKVDADIAACDFFTETGKKAKVKRQKQEDIKCMDHDSLMKFFFRVNGEKSFYSVWNMLCKKEVVGDCRFPEGKITEDLLFTYLLYCNCKKYSLSNQKKYFYFNNPIGVTRKVLGEKDLALLTNWDIIVEDIKNRKPQMIQYALMNRWRADFTLLSKAFLYGYDEKEITNDVISNLKFNLKRNKKALQKSQMLDWKRKILLIYICIFAK